MTSKAELSNLVRDYTSKQSARKNAVWNAGWRFEFDNWDGGVFARNVKTGEERFGNRNPLKNGGWSKLVEWEG